MGRIKKVVITIVMFAIAMALVAGVIIPLMNHGKEVGQGAYTRSVEVGDQIVDILK